MNKRRYLNPADDKSNIVSLDTRPVQFPQTNAEFLVGIFGAGQAVQSMNFRGDPADKSRKGGFKGKWEILPKIGAKDEMSSNTYFCISTFHKNNAGNYQRSLPLFKECFVIPIDDVGTKGKPLEYMVDKLRPSYVIETSPGNYQIGYLLDRPCKDKKLLTETIKVLNDAYGDKGAKAVNRVMRLPYGVHGGKNNFKVRFHDDFGWSGLRYSVDELIKAFNIDFNQKSDTQIDQPQNTDNIRKLSYDELFDNWSSDAVDKPDIWVGDPNTGEPDLTNYHDDWSSADQALVNHLYKWFQGNSAYIDRAFRRSALMRDKWERRDDYRARTIKKASVGKDGQPTQIYDPDSDIAVINPSLSYQGKNIKSSLGNAIILLKQEGIDLSFDEFPQEEYINGRRTEDNDITGLIVLMEAKYDVEFTTDKMNRAMAAVALSNRFDSLKNYFAELPTWDGKDYIKLLCDKIGVDSSIQEVFMRKQIIASVSRAMVAGSEVHTAAILLGDQGTGKSKLVRELCPNPDWFDDTISGKLNHKDELAKTCGKWHVELAELASLNRTTNDEAKQFMTIREDKYRPPYGRKIATFPRRFVYWGSTNRDDYLSDETGNRRYFPIGCAHPKDAVEWLKEGNNKDMLWSQALHLYNAGEEWWLTNEEETEQATLTEEHRKKGFAEQQLIAWIETGEGCFACTEQSGADGINVKADEDGVKRKHFVKAIDVQSDLSTIMGRPPSIFDVAKSLRLIGWVEHPEITTAGRKPSPYKYSVKGVNKSAPRGFAGPTLNAELEHMTKAERGKRIAEELSK